jgi:GT2 family glycosyltransferase
MSTAIVILNWNGELFLKQFLPSVIAFTKNENTRIIVADNASSDASIALLESDFPMVEIITLDKNYGFAGGYNNALKQVEADYYVLLNSDVQVTSGWLTSLEMYMNQNQDVAACQPKIRSFHEPFKFEHAGAAGGFIDKFGYPFCRGRVFGDVETDNAQYDSNIDIFWATGACLMIRSQVYWEVGGLDDEFFAHMEEIDLCWRIKSRGYRVVCVPESVVLHVGGGTLSVESPFKTYLNFRNNLLMLYKNLPENRLKTVMCWKFILDHISVIKFALSGRWRNAKSVLKAQRDYRRMKPRFIDKRKVVLMSTKVACFDEISSKSLVFNYFVLGRKLFDQLF